MAAINKRPAELVQKSEKPADKSRLKENPVREYQRRADSAAIKHALHKSQLENDVHQFSIEKVPKLVANKQPDRPKPAHDKPKNTVQAQTIESVMLPRLKPVLLELVKTEKKEATVAAELPVVAPIISSPEKEYFQPVPPPPISLETETAIPAINIEIQAAAPKEIFLTHETSDITSLDVNQEIINEVISDEELPASFDVLDDSDKEELLSEISVEAVKTTDTEPVFEPEKLPEASTEYIQFATLLDVPNIPDAADTETVAVLKHVEVTPLPIVCIEVMQAIQLLQATEPEQAKAAVEDLQKISIAVDKVIQLRASGNELAPDAEEKLEILCIELFSRLGWALEPETMKEFIQGVILTKQTVQIFAAKKATEDEQGTHEIKQEHDQIFGGLIQGIEDSLTRAIGTRAVQNYQFSLAG